MRRMCKSFVRILLKALCAIARNKAVSVACRRPSHFSLLAHAAAGTAANGEAGPKGGGQDARSQEKWPREMASFNQYAEPTSRLCRRHWNYSRLRDTQCGHSAPYLETESWCLRSGLIASSWH